MISNRRVYVLTVHAPDKRTLRVWTGKSLHALRHCSVKQIDHTLMEIQQHVDDLQRTIRTLTPSGSYSLNRFR